MRDQDIFRFVPLATAVKITGISRSKFYKMKEQKKLDFHYPFSEIRKPYIAIEDLNRMGPRRKDLGNG